VAWKVLHANVPHPWKPEWIALLRVFTGLVPPGWTVIMMTDRGLYARWLYQEIVALGWHPVMRITHQTTRYVLAVGGEADEAEFASATVPEPAGPSAKAATGPEPASSGPGTAPPRRRSASQGQTARPPRCGGPGRSSAWSACSDKAWRCC